MSVYKKFLWAAIVVLGAVSFGIVALARGEPVNAAWLVIAAVCTYFISYRLYGLFIASKVLGVNSARQTPAYRRNDGLDYVPTNRYVLFGLHFAAIAGAGPLVGPVLASLIVVRNRWWHGLCLAGLAALYLAQSFGRPLPG